MSTRKFVAYFDSLGFEFVVDITDTLVDMTFTILKEEEDPSLLSFIQTAILRARCNPHRWPEIWSFESSDITLDELNEMAEHTPQILADTIRSKGISIYRSPQQECVIR